MSHTSEMSTAWGDAEKQRAREEITELKARYCRFLDCKQWQDYAGVFAPDGVSQFGPDPEEGAVVGREAIIALLSKQLKGAVTAHRIHPGEFRFHENGEASALWPMDDRVAKPGFVLEGAGYYEERYRRIDGQWFIQHMRIHRLRVDITPAGWLRPTALGMRLVFLLQNIGLLKLLSPAASKTLAQAHVTGIEEGLFT
jgi:SnoaL-like domain